MQLLQLIDDGSIFSLLITAFLLNWIGRIFIASERAWLRKSVFAGVIVFFLYLGRQLLRDQLYDAEMLLSSIVRGGLAGAIVCGFMCLLIPICSATWNTVVTRPIKGVQSLIAGFFGLFRRPVRVAPPQAVRQPQDDSDDKRRRDAARYECQVFYDTHPEIAQALPPERFQQYFKTYLSDRETPETVEARSKDFVERMSSMIGGEKEKQWSTEDDIVNHFSEAMEQYRRSGLYNDDELESLQTDLRVEMHEELTKFRSRKVS